MCGEGSIYVHRVPSLSVSECPCGSCIFWLVARKTCIVGHGAMVDVSNKIIFVNVWMDVGLDWELFDSLIFAFDEGQVCLTLG